MKAHAITEARTRMRRAQNALVEVQRINLNFDRQEDAWWTFLIAADQIYEKLRKGSRLDPRSRQWFGGKEKARKDDPLLQYIHQARNSDQHGLAPSTSRTKFTLVAEYGCEIDYDEEGNVKKLRATVGVPMSARAVPPEIKLVTVRDDRFKDEFDPPTKHLGQPLSDNSPAAVATLALAYLAALIDEAETYVR